MDAFGGLAHRLDLVQREMDGTAAKKRLAALGLASKPDVAAAVAATLGDLSMSHWTRSKPVEITGRYVVPSDHEVVIEPAGKAKGPMRVLESGRQSYAAGDRRKSGTYVSKRTGQRTDKTRAVKRNTAATAGKGTWSDATEIMARTMPARYERLFVRDLGKHLRGG